MTTAPTIRTLARPWNTRSAPRRGLALAGMCGFILMTPSTSAAAAAATPAPTWEVDGRAARLHAKSGKLQANGDLEKALRKLNLALEAAPQAGALLLARGQLARAAGDLPTAREVLGRGQQVFPERVEFPAALVELHVQQGDLAGAAPAAQAAFALKPELPLPRAVVGWAAAEAAPGGASAWLKAYPEPFPDRPCLDARAAREAGDGPGALVGLAACRRARGALAGAATDLLDRHGVKARIADLVAPEALPAHSDQAAGVGRLLREGRPEDAVYALQGLVDAFPADLASRVELARALRELGGEREAVAVLDATLTMDWQRCVGPDRRPGVLHPLDADEAAALMGAAALLRAQLLLDGGDALAARDLLAATRARVGDQRALTFGDALVNRALAPPPPPRRRRR